MKKWMRALALTTAVILMSSAAASFAEGEDAPAPEPPKQEEPQREEPKKEAPKAEAPKAEAPAEAPKAEEPKAEAPAETPAAPEAPAESAAPAETEAPAESEAPAETPDPEGVVMEDTAAPAEGEEVEIEDSETPKGVFTDANNQPVPFTGSVKVERKGEGAIFFGDKVTLVAKIRNANTAYDIRWEVNRQDGAGWKTISGETDDEYDFIITPDNAGYEYRVVLVTAA